MIRNSTKSFKEITGKRLGNFSLLNQFPILLENNEYFFNIFNNYSIDDNIKENENYISYYDVTPTDFWENIADTYYNNKYLWWLVAMVNDIVNPFEELNSGDTIKLLDGRFLTDIVKDLKSL